MKDIVAETCLPTEAHVMAFLQSTFRATRSRVREADSNEVPNVTADRVFGRFCDLEDILNVDGRRSHA